MEEIEVPTEAAQEEIHHHAEHSRERWIAQVALSSAIFAVLAAIAALMAGHHSNEAVIDEIRAAQEWNYFNSKGIKLDVLQARFETMALSGHELTAADHEREEKLKKDKEEISKKAKGEQEAAEGHLRIHHVLATSVTLFQITIAIGAISVLTKRRRFWVASLLSGAIGIVFFIQGFAIQFLHSSMP
jgi:hypothetical protein